MTKRVAVFDFDGTLVEGDSLWPFLVALRGKPATVIAYAIAILSVGLGLAAGEDKRTYIKDRVLRTLLHDVTPEQIQDAVKHLLHWRRWKQDVVDKLRAQKAAGCEIVIASGGLSVYLPQLLKGLPYDRLICSEMEWWDGRTTGYMKRNCVRQNKAQCVAEDLKANGPYEESWGYGNLPHDRAMLDLVDNRTII
jgi:HAD superfamily phosphoserine phosphatase-like hydrolase